MDPESRISLSHLALTVPGGECSTPAAVSDAMGGRSSPRGRRMSAPGRRRLGAGGGTAAPFRRQRPAPPPGRGGEGIVPDQLPDGTWRMTVGTYEPLTPPE